MKRRPKAPAEASFWPGYVDALTNVVLNLLFLISILAAGVFSLGMESARKVARQVLTLPQSAEPNVPAVSIPDELVTRIRIVDVPEPAITESARVELKGVRNVAGRREITLNFGVEAVRIGEIDRQNLLPKLGPMMGQNTGDILVWGATDTKDPIQRRATYLRIMAARDLLIASGQPPERIETRLLSGGSTQSSGQSIYIIFQQDKKNEK